MHITNKIKYIILAVFLLLCIYLISHSNEKICNYKYELSRINSGNFEALNDLLKELFDASSEQNLIDPNVLLKTLEFWLMNVDQYDERLIKFIKTLVKVPPKKNLNLKEPNRVDHSQHGQSLYMDNLLNKTKNGFYIEAGAYDGEFLSNSLFFETQRNWNGLLIEPIPSQFKSLQLKNRHAYLLNACISSNKPYIAKFRVLHLISGIEHDMSNNHKNRIKQESLVNNKTTYKIAYIPCFPLFSILKAINVKNIDYFSLDVEGGELNVINSIPFADINIKSFTIEWPGNAINRDKIFGIMVNNGFKLLKDDQQDLYFIR
jgi:hypothetical protein